MTSDTMLATVSPRERELRGRDNERLELPMPRQANSLRERFMAKVGVFSGPDECWMWIASHAGRDPLKQYGKIWNGKRSAAGNSIPDQAHRVSYELFVGEIPEGFEVDHLCRNTMCVNPWHLEAVTRRENNLRGTSPAAMQAKQTHCKRGHALDGGNTYVWKGMRRCRECNRVQAAEYRARVKR